MKELLRFLEEVEQFKYVRRITHNPQELGVCENDAEHSWHLAMMVLALHEQHPDLDLGKCLSFAIIHDLPELYAGDTPILSAEESTKHEREARAIEKILSLLPDGSRERFEKLFGEYESRGSREARFVYELDKIQPMIINVLGGGYGWKKYKIPKDALRKRKLETVSDEFGLREVLDYYHMIAEEKGLYYE